MAYVEFKFSPTDTLRIARALREAALTRKWENNPIGETSYAALAEFVERRLMVHHEAAAHRQLARAVTGCDAD